MVVVRLPRLRSCLAVILWSPTLVYPTLTARTRLGTDRIDPPRAPILDRDGKPIVELRPVVEVGLQRNRVHDVTASATAVAKVLGIGAAAYIRQVRGAGPVEFVVAETMRPADYAKVAKKLQAIPGSITSNAALPLAPSFEFGRALLGAVAPATAEQIRRSHGSLQVGDDVGQWGLEAEYNRHLAGTQDVSIIVAQSQDRRRVADARDPPGQAARAAPHDALDTCAERRGDRARLVDRSVGDRRRAAVVRRHPGGRERPIASTFDRALAGAYAPGSTFKVITTWRCSSTASTRDLGAVSDDDRRRRPHVPELRGRERRLVELRRGLRDLVQHRIRLARTAAARDGPSHDRAPVRAWAGTRTCRSGQRARTSRRAATPVSRAAMMIGQDRIVATPLAMAGVAATVANGAGVSRAS